MAAPSRPRAVPGSCRARGVSSSPSLSSSSPSSWRAVLPLVVDEYYTLVLYQVLIYIALAQAWNLLAGYGGLVSLAPAASVGIGMYTAAVLANHFNLGVPLLVIGGGLVAAVFALLVSVPMFRFRGLYFAIATLVLGTALGVFMVNWNGLGGAVGLFLATYAPSAMAIYYYSLLLAVASSVIVFIVLRTRLGLSLRAIRDDEDTAQEIGVSTFRTKLWVWVVSSFLIGMVGGLQAVRLGTVEPVRRLLAHLDHQHRQHDDRRRHRHDRRSHHRRRVHHLAGRGPLRLSGDPRRHHRRDRDPDHPVRAGGHLGIAISLYGRFVGRGKAGRRPKRRRRSRSTPTPPAWPPTARGWTRPASRERSCSTTEAITKRFGDVVAVSEVSLEVRRGEVLGIIGPNGAGKSTVRRHAERRPGADGGVVMYDGADVTHVPADKRARMGIGRTHQIPRPVPADDRVREPAGGAPRRRPLRDGLGVHDDCEAILHDLGLASVAHATAADLTLLQPQAARAGARAGARAAHPAHGRDRRRPGRDRDPRAHRGDQGAARRVEAIVHHRAHHGRHHRVLRQGRRARLRPPDRRRPRAEGAGRARSGRVYLGTGLRGRRAARRGRTPATADARPILTLDGVSVGYGRFRALSGVGFDVHQGEVVALLGTNGAGKTTAARVDQRR